MSEVRGLSHCSLGDLDRLLTSGDRVVVLGAPEIGVSSALDALAADGELRVVRPNTLGDSPESAPRPIPTVIDDFFEIVSRYLDEPERREEIREAVQATREGGRTFVRTTPYRFEWLLEHHPGEIDALLGDVTDWTVKTVECDRDDAREQVAEWGLTATDDQLEATEWPDEPYDLRAALAPHVEGDVSQMLAVEEYRTLDPAMLRGAGDPDAALDQHRAIGETLSTMLGDLSFANAVEVATGQDEGLLGAITDVGDTLLDTAVDPVVDALGLDAGLIGGAAGAAGGAVGGPPLAIGSIALWAYLSRRQSGRSREIIHEEFETIFDAGRPTTTAARRESIERERNLPPTSLEALDRTTRAVGDRGLDGVADDLGETRDTVASVLEDHRDTLERIESAVETARPVFKSLAEFRTEQYELPDYVKPDPEDDRPGPEDLLEHLRTDRSSVTFLVGESGVGKTRLAIEVGERLSDETDIWYVRQPPKERPPPGDADRVVYVLDEPGEWKAVGPHGFIDQVSSRTWECETLHVVVTVRPVHENQLDLEHEVSDHVPQRTIEMAGLSQAGTRQLLDDTIDDETVERIHRVTEGNPLLAQLLALAERGHDGEKSPEKKLEEVISNLFEEPAEERDDPTTAVRKLLESIAIVGQFDTGRSEWGDDFADVIPNNYRDILIDLSETKYVEQHPGDTFDPPTYSHRIDVLAEYLRWRVLKRDPSQYADIVASCLDANPADLARGLVELRESTLARFDFFHEETVHEQTQTLLGGKIAPELPDCDAPLPAVLEAATWVTIGVPGDIDHMPLLETVDTTDIDSDGASEVAEQVYDLVTLSYRREIETEAGRSVGAKWLDRLKTVAENNADDEEIQLALAKGLVNAINAGETEHLDRLETVAKNNADDGEIQLELAKGLVNAIGAGETEHLDRLKTVAESHEDDEEIQLALANGLFNAITAGETEHLDRLETVAEDNADDEEIQLALAQGLVNAIGAGETEHLDRLETVAEDNADDEEIQLELAKGLVNAINAGETEHLDRLETVAENNADDGEIQLRLAQGLVNAIGAGETEHLDRLETVAENNADDEEIQLELANGLFNAITAGETEHLDRLETVAEDNADDEEIQLALAQGLVNAIGAGETEHLDRLETVAVENPDHDGIRTVALLGHLLALEQYIDPDDFKTDAALSGLEAIASGGQCSLTVKTDGITALAVDAAEAFVRAEAIEAFERFVTALDTILEPGRWTTVEGRIVTAAIDLEREGVISIDVLTAVTEILEDLE